MNLSQLLRIGKDPSFLDSCCVVWLEGTCEAPVFAHFFVKSLVQSWQPHCSVVSIDCSTHSEQTLIALLETSFLGESRVFFLKNIQQLSTTTQKKHAQHLSNYRGPHKVFVIGDGGWSAPIKNVSSAGVILQFEPTVTREHYQSLYHFIHGAVALDERFTEQLFSRHKQITLDSAYMLVSYHYVLGRQHGDFFDQWFARIVPRNMSLFYLSQYFFSKNFNKFSQLWHSFSAQYSDGFWITYWSEQLWQACTYRETMGCPQRTHTHFRLPFSFMQRDWKSYQYGELARAYSFLYSVDHDLKHSAGTVGIDMFCYKFLLNGFK